MEGKRPYIIGLSASLRNARFGVGSRALRLEIAACRSERELRNFLSTEASFCVDEFVRAGRNRGLSFDQIYRNYQRRKGERGLSNSEAALVAGMWGAKQAGADVEHISLDSVFGARASEENRRSLRNALDRASGVLLSGPVYFGDRGSLAEDFVRFVREDHLRGANSAPKVYAGISVGAKRNGGQETTLIYQMIDMSACGFLAVGNDAKSTSQYGGTVWAGDVGTMAGDKYGLMTAIGTGRRLADVSRIVETGSRVQTGRKPRIAVWLLQDKNGRGRHILDSRVRHALQETADVTILDFTRQTPRRCIACDICPSQVGPDEEYRCIIRDPEDLFLRQHNDILGYDGIVVAGYSGRCVREITSVYQRFIERTRYIRRGEYALSNTLVIPLVFEEVGARDSLSLRMLTSMIRHNTILHGPVVVNIWRDNMLNLEEALGELKGFAQTAALLARGKGALQENPENCLYNPVGYELSREHLSENISRRRRFIQNRSRP